MHALLTLRLPRFHCLLVLAAFVTGAVAAAAAPGPSGRSSVVVVHGQASLPNDGERRFALSLARHAVRWFREGGVEVDLEPDVNLGAALAGRRVALLAYCGQPPPPQMQAIRRFVEAGGKLIVCYSMSAELADAMGMRGGQYLKSGDGRWSAMRFESSRPANVPARVQQASPNLFVIEPVAGRSRVLAWWEDRQGRRMPEPAWLASDRGFWMTHVLLADGDAAGKEQLLLALAGACDPSLWLTAARQRYGTSLRIGPYADLAQVAAAASQVPDTARRSRALGAVGRSEALRRDAVALLESRRGAEAWLAVADLRRQLAEAYGYLQSPRRGEIRAVWDHSGVGLYPGDWSRTCRVLKQSGVSDIFVNVAGPGFAHCRIATLPPSPLLAQHGDQLAACLAAARPLGLRVHPWLICFSTTMATPDRLETYRRKGWLLTGPDGGPREWLDPAVPEARAMLVDAGREILERYAVDGLHLDFVRYPDFKPSLGPTVRSRFERSRGAAVPNWPEGVEKGPLSREFSQWRCRQVTDLVADMRLVQRRAAPAAWLSAAVYGKYPSCVDAVGQAWETWVEQGLVDYVAPMNYTESPALFRSLVTSQTRTPRLAGHMLCGLGVTASESRLDAAAVIDQIQIVRAGGAAGFALFDLDTTLENEILPILRLGATAPDTPRRRWWFF